MRGRGAAAEYNYSNVGEDVDGLPAKPVGEVWTRGLRQQAAQLVHHLGQLRQVVLGTHQVKLKVGQTEYMSNWK